MQLRPGRSHRAADIVACRKAIRAQFARHLEQVSELGSHIAADAGHRRASGKIFVGELLDHVFAEGAFMIEDVMCDAEPVCHSARIGDIVTRAARSLAAGGCAIIIQLECYADDFGPAGVCQRCHDRRIDAARHGDHDAALARRFGQVEQRLGIDPGVGGCRI